MRFGLPLILGLITFFEGTTFTFGHYRPDALLPFEVLQPLLPPHLAPWFTAQHAWGLLYLAVGISLLIPVSAIQRSITLIIGAALWGSFGLAMAANATVLDPLHHTGAATGIVFLGTTASFILAIRSLYMDWHADRAVLVRWCACVRRKLTRS